MANTKKRKSSKRRKNKKTNAKTTLIVMLVIIFVVIAFFAIEAIKNNNPDKPEETESQVITQQSGISINAEDDFNYQESDNTEAHSTEENSEVSTTEETTTEPATLPLTQEPRDVSDIVISHYTDFMGVPEGALFINSGETDETATGYTFTLRLNIGNSPNKLVGDVYVEKGTGKVTDSMGNDSWYISED